MNFEFTDEQSMIRDSLSRYLRDKYDFDARGKILKSEEGWSRQVWTDLAEMGIMAEPMIPNALSMPCICSVLTKASSVVIFMGVSPLNVRWNRQRDAPLLTLRLT